MSSPVPEPETPGFIDYIRNGITRPAPLPAVFLLSLLVFIVSVIGGFAFFVNDNRALPGLSLNFLAAGDRYYMDGQYNNARREYQRAVDIAPADPQSLISLGVVYNTLGDTDRAMQLFKKALSHKPTEPSASHYVGILYLERGQPREAIPYIALSARNRSGVDAAQAYNDLGVAYSRAGDLARAAENYRKALQLNPRLSAAQQNLNAVEQQNP